MLLTIGSSGGFILIYGLLWLLIPEATTTSQKLDMRGGGHQHQQYRT
ncbi:hypothetical protein ACU8V7_02410 [Zobellia nedashkovskayae]